jgi:hypothetical protein
MIKVARRTERVCVSGHAFPGFGARQKGIDQLGFRCRYMLWTLMKRMEWLIVPFVTAMDGISCQADKMCVTKEVISYLQRLLRIPCGATINPYCHLRSKTTCRLTLQKEEGLWKAPGLDSLI